MKQTHQIYKSCKWKLECQVKKNCHKYRCSNFIKTDEKLGVYTFPPGLEIISIWRLKKNVLIRHSPPISGYLTLPSLYNGIKKMLHTQNTHFSKLRETSIYSNHSKLTSIYTSDMAFFLIKHFTNNHCYNWCNKLP